VSGGTQHWSFDHNGALRSANGTGGHIELTEISTPPSGTTSDAKIFAEDNGAGKTRIMAQFQTGGKVLIAIEV